MHTVFTFSDGGEKVAVLPFLLDRCFVAGRPVYLVTELEFGFSHPQFVSGVEVTHWNGVPIGRVVDAVADRTGAGNAEARSARGLAALTQRPLRYMERPDESWVVVTYLNQDQRQDIRFTWQTVTVPRARRMRAHAANRVRAGRLAGSPQCDATRVSPARPGGGYPAG